LDASARKRQYSMHPPAALRAGTGLKPSPERGSSLGHAAQTEPGVGREARRPAVIGDLNVEGIGAGANAYVRARGVCVAQNVGQSFLHDPERRSTDRRWNGSRAHIDVDLGVKTRGASVAGKPRQCGEIEDWRGRRAIVLIA
jgi:hypothetical protein